VASFLFCLRDHAQCSSSLAYLQQFSLPYYYITSSHFQSLVSSKAISPRLCFFQAKLRYRLLVFIACPQQRDSTGLSSAFETKATNRSDFLTMASNGVPTSKYAMDETVPLIWGSSGNNGTGGYNNTRSKASVAAPPRADIFAVPGALADENNKRKPSFVEEQSGLSSNGSGDDDGDHESTTVAQTFIHLVKGYMGAGCLSLPWAVTQLGLTGGIISIFAMSYWSSYNCWTVVKLKRFIEHRIVPGVGGGINVSMSRKPPARVASSVDDRASETSSLATTATNVTYPHVGEWAYGAEFQSYVTTCICVQQLAICTVFISFVGENLMAVLKMMGAPASASSHAAVMTYVIPFVLSLSFIPNLKLLAPVMVRRFIKICHAMPRQSSSFV
jgi:hypothetical protein